MIRAKRSAGAHLSHGTLEGIPIKHDSTAAEDPHVLKSVIEWAREFHGEDAIVENCSVDLTTRVTRDGYRKIFKTINFRSE